MMTRYPKTLLFIASGLLLFGWAVPFLMIMQMIESSYFLSFLSWAASISGLFLGVVGAATYVRMRKK